MKKNFKKVGMILSMVAMVSFTMTSCGETAEDATEGEHTEENAHAEGEEGHKCGEDGTKCGDKCGDTKKVEEVLNEGAAVIEEGANAAEGAANEFLEEGAEALEGAANDATDAVKEAGADALNNVENAIH